MSLIVVFTNDSTGSLEKGNYNVRVYINDRQIAKRKLDNSARDGWETQVIDLAKKIGKEGK